MSFSSLDLSLSPDPAIAEMKDQLNRLEDLVVRGLECARRDREALRIQLIKATNLVSSLTWANHPLTPPECGVQGPAFNAPPPAMPPPPLQPSSNGLTLAAILPWLGDECTSYPDIRQARKLLVNYDTALRLVPSGNTFLVKTWLDGGSGVEALSIGWVTPACAGMLRGLGYRCGTNAAAAIFAQAQNTCPETGEARADQEVLTMSIPNPFQMA